MQSMVLLAWFVWAVACALGSRVIFQRILTPRIGRYAYPVACLGWVVLLAIGFLIVRSVDALVTSQLSYSAYAMAYWTVYFSPFGLPTFVGAPVVLLSDLVRSIWKRLRRKNRARQDDVAVGSRSGGSGLGVRLAGGSVLLMVLGFAVTITPPPSHALADEIDQLIEQDPCIGDVDEWDSRSYLWSASPRDGRANALWYLSAPWVGSDRAYVDLHFHQGPAASFYPRGRHRVRADQALFVLDDSNTKVAFGTYDVRARRLIDWSCGPNRGEAASTDPEPPSEAS